MNWKMKREMRERKRIQQKCGAVEQPLTKAFYVLPRTRRVMVTIVMVMVMMTMMMMVVMKKWRVLMVTIETTRMITVRMRRWVLKELRVLVLEMRWMLEVIQELGMIWMKILCSLLKLDEREREKERMSCQEKNLQQRKNFEVESQPLARIELLWFLTPDSFFVLLPT